MTRILLIIAALIAVVGIIVSLWLISVPSNSPEPAPTAVTAPQQFDTTGGQQMRPRWNREEGQGDDATNK